MSCHGLKPCGRQHLRRRLQFFVRSDLIMDPEEQRDFFTVASLLVLAEPEMQTQCAALEDQWLEVLGSVLVVMATLLDARHLQSSLGTREAATALATHIFKLINARCLLMDGVRGFTTDSGFTSPHTAHLWEWSWRMMRNKVLDGRLFACATGTCMMHLPSSRGVGQRLLFGIPAVRTLSRHANVLQMMRTICWRFMPGR